MTNFTAAHESRAREVGPARFDYPDRHIEADNRLTWLLGGLAAHERRGDRYVWLQRPTSDVAASFLRRWEAPTRISIMEAFAHGIIMEHKDWPAERRAELVWFYIEMVEANIIEFITDRPHLTVQLGEPGSFRRFWQWIGANGDLEAALDTWALRHN